MAKMFRSMQEEQLAVMLKKGAVGILPTDTVYGIVGSAQLPSVVGRIHEVKRRTGKLGTVIAASIEQLIELGLSESDLRTVEHLWPNPLSVIIAADDSLRYLHLDVGSVAVRIPKDDVLLRLLKVTGPLATTSANLADQPTVATISEAQDVFRDTVDFYVDGGILQNRPPSSIIKLDDGKVTVLRPGAVTINEQGQIT